MPRSVKPASLWLALALILGLGLAAPVAYGQAVALRGDVIAQSLAAEGMRVRILNGPQAYGPARQADDVKARALMPLVLALTAHRLAGQEVLGLDDRLTDHVPDLVDDPPFTVPLLVRHLLTGSAGYARPPWLTDDTNAKILEAYRAPLRRYLLALRTAGQVAQDDMVGWAVLIAVLERVSGQPLANLISTEVLNPLGLNEGDIIWPDFSSPTARAFGPLLAARITPKAEAQLIRLLFRNRTDGGAPYLSADGFTDLTARVNVQPHPLMSGRTAGLERRLIGDRWALVLPGGCHIIFPEIDAAFLIAPGQAGGCEGTQALADIQRRDFPSSDRTAALAQARTLPAPKTLLGRYAPEAGPAAHLSARVDQMLRSRSIAHRAGGALTLSGVSAQGGSKQYVPVAPYAFSAGPGDYAVFSRYRLGGYAEISGAFYRYTGLIGDPRMALWPIPIALVILLSAVLHWREQTAPEWRRMARVSVVAVGLITLGFAADYALWPWARYQMDWPWLVTLWRIALNIGVALALSVVLYVLSITRRGLLPLGAKALWAPVHLVLIAPAALVVFLCLVALGLAGNF